MKVTLIMPGVGCKPGETYIRSWLMEPLGLAVLAAATPEDVEVVLADDRLDPIPYDEPTDLVGINVETYTARRAYAIAARFRARGVPVVLGGYHPTLVPEDARGHADAIVLGQADRVWPRVVEDARRGRLQTLYRECGEAPPRAVTPRRSLLAGRPYLPITLVESGRGCRFACDFCSVSRFFERQATPRPIEDVVAEIEAAERRTVFFVDDNIVADPGRAKRLFRAIKPAGIQWFSQGSITMADDPGLLAAMRASGCRGLLIGFESLSPATLAAMGKSWNRAVRDYDESLRRIREAGIPIYATFVFGYDTDEADVFDRTLDFALEQRLYMAAFNHLVPFPGTPLYARLAGEGRLRYDPWWLDPDYRFGEVVFEPRNMSAEELAERCFQARKAFYRFGSILSRARDRKSNCPDLAATARYFWMNLFSNRQTRKRQGLPLASGFPDPPEERERAQVCL